MNKEQLKELKKGESIILDESGNLFCLDFIIERASKRECLLCRTNLDKDIGEGKWHIPLCKKHRMKELSKIYGDSNE